MQLTIREAAQLLQRSTRTLRDQLRRGDIAGTRHGRAWRIDSALLPMTEAQRQAVLARVQSVRDAVEDAVPARARRRRSVTDLEPFRAGQELLRAMPEPGPGASNQRRVRRLIERALVDLSEAAQEYDLQARQLVLRRARARFSRAVGYLLVGGGLADDTSRWVDCLETRILPQLGGLLRWTERRAHQPPGRERHAHEPHGAP